MSRRQVYHVTRRGDNSWQVVKEGFHRPHVVRGTREEAVVLAKRLAKTDLEAQVVIHDRNDQVEMQFGFHQEAA